MRVSSASVPQCRQLRNGLVILLAGCVLSLLSHVISIGSGVLRDGLYLAIHLATLYGMYVLMPLHGIYIAAGIGYILNLLLLIPSWLYARSANAALVQQVMQLITIPVYSGALGVVEIVAPVLLMLGHWLCLRREHPAPARGWLIFTVAQLLINVMATIIPVLLLTDAILGKWGTDLYMTFSTVVQTVNYVLTVVRQALLVWSICAISRPCPQPEEVSTPADSTF